MYQVHLAQGAEQDLEELYDYVCRYDCVDNADSLLDELIILANSLSEYPERGSIPNELIGLGIKEYRQVFFKPYRLVYRIYPDIRQVSVYLIIDGRRDVQSLLERRLLR